MHTSFGFCVTLASHLTSLSRNFYINGMDACTVYLTVL